MNEPTPQIPPKENLQPEVPTLEEAFQRLTRIEAGQSEILTRQDKIIALLEAPAIAEEARQAKKAEEARKLDQAYASGDLGYIGG